MLYIAAQFSSVQLLSRVQLFATPWIAARQASLSFTNSWSSPRLMSIESVMPPSHLILCRPLLLLPPIPPSIRVFSILHLIWVRIYFRSSSLSRSVFHLHQTIYFLHWNLTMSIDIVNPLSHSLGYFLFEFFYCVDEFGFNLLYDNRFSFTLAFLYICLDTIRKRKSLSELNVDKNENLKFLSKDS